MDDPDPNRAVYCREEQRLDGGRFATRRLKVKSSPTPKGWVETFDGDEMNMHVPQSIAAATELRYLASVLRNIISPRTNSPIIQLFQDTMTGIYRITLPDVTVPEVVAMNIIAKIKRPFTRKNAPWTGAEIISAAFPIMNFKGSVTIENGQLVKGIMRKSACTALIHTVYNDFGPERAGQLINDIQSVVTRFNLFTGFSVGTADLISNIETQQFVDGKLAEARASVAAILTDIHAGTFKNVSGMSDGEDLEDKISSALKTVASDINMKVVKSLPADNRMIQMVNSGSKGGPQNITQMVALLGQQLIEGRRVQYTLQDRTLPHFARYDDGAESRGFVQNSFVSGLMPAEFFFHAQAGREGLIDTAVKTSDTGYIQRRLMKTMEDQHLEYDGSVRNVLGSVIQYVYGEDGVDTQSVEEQVIPLAEMSMETIYKEYALSPADVNPFLNTEVDTSPDLVDAILADRDLLVKHVFRYRKGEDKVSTPVNVERLLSKFSNSYSTKTSLTPTMVVETIAAFTNEFPANKVFHAILRFFLAPKKAIVVHRLTEEMFKELMAEIRFRYVKAQCHAGEMVGVLAAQSIGEPTTQLTLNTFHSAGTVKANATSGVPRIEELLSASANPKRPGNTAYLTLNTTKREAIAKMKEIQKTTLRNITRSVRIYYDPYPLAATTVMDEDREVLGLYEQFAQGKAECTSPWVMRLELDDQEMVNRNIMDLVEVQAKIQNSMTGVDVKCVTSDRNASKLILRLEVAASLVKNPTVLRQLEDSILNSPLTGMDGIGRVFVRTLKNEMLYDEPLGGYVTKDQYVLDLEGTNLYDLFVFPGVDMTRTFSNDIHEINEVFGIETARIALYEEFNEVFSSEKVNYHHLSVLVDSMTFSGRIVPVNRFGMKKNETGVLAKSSFEETSKVMFEAAVGAEYDTMRGVSANIMFGQKPPCGTGFVDILVDESKLPEGPEGTEGADTTDLDEANKALQAADVGECRIEDLSMW